MSDNNIEEMMKMWKEQPETVQTIFPAGMAYEIREGDTLSTLAKDFGLQWEEIADATMGTHNPNKINTWLSNNGGKKLKSGYWSFSIGQSIMIPAPTANSANV